MVFGGILIEGRSLPAFNQAIGVWRQANRMHAELKWAKVSGQKLAEYKLLVDLFFSLAGRGGPCFRSVVFDTSQIDYRMFHRGDKELGFYKFFYQFLLHSFGRFARDDKDRLLVFLDRRTTSYKLSTLYAVLNRGIRKKYDRRADVVRKIEAVDSHGHDVLQLADVLMGAVGYHNNDCHLRPGAKLAKVHLADLYRAEGQLAFSEGEDAVGGATLRHLAVSVRRRERKSALKPTPVRATPEGFPRRHRGFRHLVAPN